MATTDKCPTCGRPGRPGVEVLEEVEMLIDSTPAAEIAQRIGMTTWAIEQTLRRQGRPDLARPFGRATYAAVVAAGERKG